MPAVEARFLVDHMLYKLGRYLRCLGFDVTWDPQASSRELVRRADAECRVFLTRNGRLEHQHALALHHQLVRANDPVEQVHEVLAVQGLEPGKRLFTRCVLCNHPLERLPADAPALEAVPPRVRAHYRNFFTCPGCATVFWRGTHVTNTCRKLGLPDAAEFPG